jgi:hypothetical protein
LTAATAIHARRRLPRSTHTLAALIGANRSCVISRQWRLKQCYIQATLLAPLPGIHGLLVGAKFENKEPSRSEYDPAIRTLNCCSCGRSAFGMRRSVPYGLQYITRRTRLRLLWNPLFRPSHDSLLRQNQEIDRLQLPRIQDNDELEPLEASQELVPIRATRSLRFDPRLDPDRRYCRPWTRDFVNDLSDAYDGQFHSPIQVNSAVRTVRIQRSFADTIATRFQKCVRPHLLISPALQLTSSVGA